MATCCAAQPPFHVYRQGGGKKFSRAGFRNESTNVANLLSIPSVECVCRCHCHDCAMKCACSGNPASRGGDMCVCVSVSATRPCRDVHRASRCSDRSSSICAQQQQPRCQSAGEGPIACCSEQTVPCDKYVFECLCGGKGACCLPVQKDLPVEKCQCPHTHPALSPQCAVKCVSIAQLKGVHRPSSPRPRHCLSPSAQTQTSTAASCVCVHTQFGHKTRRLRTPSCPVHCPNTASSISAANASADAAAAAATKTTPSACCSFDGDGCQQDASFASSCCSGSGSGMGGVDADCSPRQQCVQYPPFIVEEPLTVARSKRFVPECPELQHNVDVRHHNLMARKQARKLVNKIHKQRLVGGSTGLTSRLLADTSLAVVTGKKPWGVYRAGCCCTHCTANKTCLDSGKHEDPLPAKPVPRRYVPSTAPYVQTKSNCC